MRFGLGLGLGSGLGSGLEFGLGSPKAERSWYSIEPRYSPTAWDRR